MKPMVEEILSKGLFNTDALMDLVKCEIRAFIKFIGVRRMIEKLIYVWSKFCLWVFPVMPSQVCKSYNEIRELQKEFEE